MSLQHAYGVRLYDCRRLKDGADGGGGGGDVDGRVGGYGAGREYFASLNLNIIRLSEQFVGVVVVDVDDGVGGDEVGGVGVGDVDGVVGQVGVVVMQWLLRRQKWILDLIGLRYYLNYYLDLLR